MLGIVHISARAAINMPAETTGFHELRKEIEADHEHGFCLSVDSRMGGSLSPVRKDHLQGKITCKGNLVLEDAPPEMNL